MRRRHFVFLVLLALPVAAQQGAAAFHHFRHSPTGQYTTVLQGTTKGLPSGPPITSTSCTVAPNPAQIAAAMSVANSAAAAQNCVVHIIRDEEKIGEYEQTCIRGLGTQVIHHTMTAIDDKTYTVDTVSKGGSIEMSTHANVHYDGPCSAAQLAETSRPTMPTPTAEDCAELAASQKDMTDSCADVPAEQRTACNKKVQAASAALAQALASCAK